MKVEDNIKEKLENLLIKMEIPFSSIDVEFLDDKEVYRANIESEEPSLLIGHHGETIGALQHLLKVLLWKEGGDQFNLILDVDNYRQRQENSVINMIKRKIDQTRETATEQAFPPMSPYFRRLVHLEVKEHSDLESESKGEGDHRYVVIKLK